ncbi:MAG TPA: thermonuclease family protein [Candidatus Binatia bacterium]|nr:thermonuclease family protein [Candidatus Binatia bacterium]
MGDRRALALAVVVLAAVAHAAVPARRTATVVEVTDGDTIVVRVDGATKRVRLIGIDTPEMHDSDKLDRDVARSGQSRDAIQAQGRAARDFVVGRLAGRTVALEADVEPRDRYGRMLAYVWLDDVLVNALILERGWGRLLTVPPNVRRVTQLRAAEQAARASRAGLWGEPVLPSSPGPTHGVPPLGGGRCPDSHPLKGNVTTRDGTRCIVHRRGDEHYAETRAERCYATVDEAQADGCRPARR